MSEEYEEDWEEVLDSKLAQFWTKLIIVDCFNKKMSMKATVEHLHQIGEFTQEVFSELAKKEGLEELGILK